MKPQPQPQPLSKPKARAQAQAQAPVPAEAVEQKAKTRLWLVRHPKPVGVDGLCYGRLDVAVDLPELDRVASCLAAQLPEGMVVRTSPASRCRVLAEAVQARRPDLQLLGSFAWLAEMDFGQWEGKPWADIPPAELRAWTDDFADYRAGGTGESVRMFLARVERGLCAATAPSCAIGETERGPDADDTEMEPASPHCTAAMIGSAGRIAEGLDAGFGRLIRSSGQLAPEVWVTHAGVMRAVHWLRERGPSRMPSAAQWPAMPVGHGDVWVIDT
ncbi:MAG: histidine phosphatase family protein [Lautropia sp.]|nr:histidine phosphatase family protein [Lautropia sp.]